MVRTVITELIAFLVLMVAVRFFGDYFPPFSIYIIGGYLGWRILSKVFDHHNALRDNPPGDRYRVTLPEAYATIKRELKCCTFGKSRWSIQYEDKTNGTINACITVIDKGFDFDGRPEYIEQSVDLIAEVVPEEDSTLVLITFSVQSEGARGYANQVIDLTSDRIHTALLWAEGIRNRTDSPDFQEEAS